MEGNEVEVLCCCITLLKFWFSFKTGSCYWAFLPVTSGKKKKKSIWRCAAVSWCLLGWQPERGQECAGTNNNKISEAVLGRSLNSFSPSSRKPNKTPFFFSVKWSVLLFLPLWSDRASAHQSFRLESKWNMWKVKWCHCENTTWRE